MDFDAVVLGAGQGGTPLAQKLAGRGLKVALVEKDQLGGTCINTGCTPTKTMVASAQVAHVARNAARFGVDCGEVRVSLARVRARKDQMVQSFRSGTEDGVKATANLTLIKAHARFLDAHRIQVGDNVISTQKSFINTGCRPAVPPLEGLDRVAFLDNRTVMELQQLPEHLLVVGGGYVGLEFAQMFHRFGCKVTVVHRQDQLLPLEDADVAEALRAALAAEGVEFRLGAKTIRVAEKDGGVALTLETGTKQETLTASHLLLATGRTPNTDDLGLDKAGVKRDARGFITVNSRLETSAPDIWALGDAKGGPAFTHVSYNDFQLIYGNVYDGAALSTETRVIPYAVFTDPQLGRVGLTEKAARATGRPLKVGKIPMANVARALERDETAGLMKLVVDASTDRILGAAVLSSEGGELIQTLGAVMLTGSPYTVLQGAMFIHPTLAEGFFGLMDAVVPA